MFSNIKFKIDHLDYSHMSKSDKIIKIICFSRLSSPYRALGLAIADGYACTLTPLYFIAGILGVEITHLLMTLSWICKNSPDKINS